MRIGREDALLGACLYSNGLGICDAHKGDDFIVITGPRIGMRVAEEVVSGFANCLPDFHGETDFMVFCYPGLNRCGEMGRFPLLSISIGILSAEVYKMTC
jgi:hypothetical protein